MGIYRIQNTSLSTYVGFTFVDIFTSVKVFDVLHHIITLMQLEP